MMRGMFAAISGLRTHQVMLDVTANDLANVNTLGYKSARTTFRDSLTQAQRGGAAAGAGTGGSNAAQVGLGTQLGSIDNLMSTGAIQSTGNVLDVAIQGSGWFRTAPATGGAEQYTRAGNFTTNAAGDLVTADGFYVLDNTGGRINIAPGSSNVAIGQDGSVNYTDATGTRQSAGPIGLAAFANEAGLERASGNRWTLGPNAGAPVYNTPGAGGMGTTMAGAVEMSNVDLAQQFTNMITAQRGFQASSRVISTSDQMLQDLVNLKG
jgi:flagellar hook protein FlgE